MKVKELMTRRVESCGRDTDLAAAAMMMWRNDCGVVPVVAEDGRKAIGVITDRDICMAVATRHLRAEEIRVGEVMTERLCRVRPEDDAHLALDVMRVERVRRLPVVGGDGTLQGMLSIKDLLPAAGRPAGRGRLEISAEEIVEALRAICEHRAVAGAVSEPLAERVPVHA
jgi:CBS domain-containing protein